MSEMAFIIVGHDAQHPVCIRLIDLPEIRIRAIENRSVQPDQRISVVDTFLAPNSVPIKLRFFACYAINAIQGQRDVVIILRGPFPFTILQPSSASVFSAIAVPSGTRILTIRQPSKT